MEGSLPMLEDVQGAAQGLMRLQDVYDLHVEGLVRGHFQQITNGDAVDIYKPPVSDTLSGDDCFLVGKVGHTVLFPFYKAQHGIKADHFLSVTSLTLRGLEHYCPYTLKVWNVF